MKKGDDAEEVAKFAYTAFRGTKVDPSSIPHWDNLSREQKGLLTFTVRWSRLTLDE